jgi:hypothetical protein
MNSDDEWDYVKGGEGEDGHFARSGILRISLLFGSIAVAFSLFLVPIINRTGLDFGNGSGLDRMTTASISKQNGSYILRRSVLQRDPAGYCVIRSDGTSSGDC